MIVQKITPFLWFDHQAEEAMNFYVSAFKNAEVGEVSRYSEGGRGETGKVMSVRFRLEGQSFYALNGGPHFTFTPAISFFVSCENQVEVDHLWEKLTKGGSEQPCGWLTDKFGVSWQIIPKALTEMLASKDREKADRVLQAMFKMSKIDIEALEAAFNQK